jgi:hypothetical protein
LHFFKPYKATQLTTTSPHHLDSFRNETFAQRAVELISTFFLDEKTKMNPNFRCVRTALPLFLLSHYHQSITHSGCESASCSHAVSTRTIFITLASITDGIETRTAVVVNTTHRHHRHRFLPSKHTS